MSLTASAVHNPFLLMLNPEIVLAAVEKSESLAQLNRHTCRPLDRIVPVPGATGSEGEGETAEAASDAALDGASEGLQTAASVAGSSAATVTA
jgi:hypothetical protein